MEDCIFCRIAEGSAPASIVYSDEEVMAIMDIQPVNAGHVLVIPKVHAAQLGQFEERMGGHMFQVGMCIAQAIRRSGIRCEGVNLFLADGKVAGQEIPHVHLHVIPRSRGDGFQIKFGTHYGLKPEREELDRIAEKIRRTMS